MLLCYYLRAMRLTNGVRCCLVACPSSPSNVVKMPIGENDGLELQRDV